MFIILLFVICALYLWSKRPLPGEPPVMPGHLPLIGHAYRLLEDTNQLWETCKELAYECMALGGVSYFNIGLMKMYVISDPDECVKVANTCLEKDSFTRKNLRNIMGNGLLISQEPIWRRHRKAINPAFNQQVLAGFIEVFNDQSRRLTKTFSKELGRGPFNHTYHLRQSAVETVCLTALGLDIRSEDNKRSAHYAETFEAILTNFVDRFKRPWLYPDFIFKWSSLKDKLDTYSEIIHDLSNTVLQRRKADYKSVDFENIKRKDTKFKPFMDLLLDLEQGTFSDQDIRDQVDTITITGHETTAAVLTYSLVLIGSYPDVQEKIVTELEEVFGKEDRDVTKNDLSRLVYMEAVINETMRFYPITPFITRFLDKDVQLNKYTLRSGHNCYLMIYGVHRHPIWGKDAEDFRPERWLDHATLPTNPNAFLAFGAGKRNCIGKAYGMMSMKIVLAHILRNYRVSGDYTKMKFKLDVFMKPLSGHHISIEKRYL